MAFEAFPTKRNKMFNIYDKEVETMLDNYKVPFPYKIFQHPGLKIAIEALKAMQTTGKAVTYTIYVNHLSMEASKLT